MRRRPPLSESLYARLGHDMFMTLFDHIGAPVAPAIRDARVTRGHGSPRTPLSSRQA
jgi:hypothetical protein